MKRRDVIAGLVTVGGGVSLAGCSQVNGSMGTRTIDKVTAETDSERLTGTSTVENRKITEDEQGSVRLGVTWNESTEAELTFGNAIPVSSPLKSTDPEGLILATAESGVVREDGKTWIAERSSTHVPLALTAKTFQPDETVSNEYFIWGNAEYSERIEPGVYRFESSIPGREGSGAISYTASIEIA